MAYSQFNRRRVIGWLREIEERGGAMPLGRALTTRFGFDNVAVADGIVAELVADKSIEIVIDARKRRCPRVLVDTAGNRQLPPPPFEIAPDEARASATSSPLPPRAEAALAGVPPSPGTAVAAPSGFERGRKPFIPASVIRAAREHDQPLDLFVTTMIAIGFEHWKASDPDGSTIGTAIAALALNRKAAA